MTNSRRTNGGPGEYVLHGNSEVEDHVAQCAQRLGNEIANILGSDIYSVALVGGFGRGEGAAALIDGDLRIGNDMDFIAVSNRNIVFSLLKYRRQLDLLAQKEAARLDFKQIDISLQSVGMLRTLPTTVAAYEMANGHRVLAGKPLPLGDYLLEPAGGIPLTEGTRYFLNRGSGLLIALRYLQDWNDLSAPDRANFTVECDKAVLAIGDSILIERGLYHYHYSERLRRLLALRFEGPALAPMNDIRPLYEAAVQRKFSVARPHMNLAQAEASAREVVKMMSSHFLEFEQRRTGKTFENWEHYSNSIVDHWPSRMSELVGRGVIALSRVRQPLRAVLPSWWRDIWLSRTANLLQTLPLLLFAENRGGINLGMVEKAATLLAVVPNTNETPDQLWTRCVNRYLLLHHPSGAAGKIAKNTPEPE